MKSAQWILRLLFIPLQSFVKPETTQSIECTIRIGDELHHEDYHRRLVSSDLQSRTCVNAVVINIDTHDGITKSFKKVDLTGGSGRRLSVKSSVDYDFWYGEDADDGSTFNYLDINGKLQGSLVDLTTKEIMQFRSDANGELIVTITHASDFKPELDPDNFIRQSIIGILNNDETHSIIFNTNEPPTVYNRSLYRPKMESSTQAQANALFHPPMILSSFMSRNLDVYDDSGGNLDVMIPWTELAECNNAGLAAGCNVTSDTYDSMMALVNLAVEETNVAYQLSGVNTQLLLVHAYRIDGYVEEGFETTLSKLQSGAIAGVHQNRESYGADIVALIMSDPEYCGLGYLGPARTLMYSATAYNCATGYLTLGHEIGHNLGLYHDRGTQDHCGVEGYQYGYRNQQALFRTIMAYNCVSGQCDNNAGGGCPRIQRFSSPDSLFFGYAFGNETEDSVRHINEVKAEVAGYYAHIEAPSTTPSTNPTTDNGPKPSAIPSISSRPSTSSLPTTIPSINPSSSPSSICGNGACEANLGETWFSCTEDCTFPNIPTYSIGSTSWTDGLQGLQTGVMFDVEAMDEKLTIYGFDSYLYHSRTDTRVQIYVTKENDSYVGKERDPSKWKMVMDKYFSWASQETKRLDLDIPIRMDANSVRGVYLTIDSYYGALVVAIGTTYGSIIDSSDHLKMKEGSWNIHQFGDFTGPLRFLGFSHYFLGWWCASDIDCNDDDEATVDKCLDSECHYTLPTITPSAVTSLEPSSAPSHSPLANPSSLPSKAPTNGPSVIPSSNPSVVPSIAPSSAPSSEPSTSPSSDPSMIPSSVPSAIFSTNPTSTSCVDETNWTSYDPKGIWTGKTCANIEEDHNVAQFWCEYLAIYPNDRTGKSSMEACCVCDGGRQIPVGPSYPSSAPSESPTGCKDESEWYWNVEEQLDCSTVTPGFCSSLSSVWYEGKNVNLACCACGGGSHLADPPSNLPSTNPSDAPTSKISEVPSQSPSVALSAIPSAVISQKPTSINFEKCENIEGWVTEDPEGFWSGKTCSDIAELPSFWCNYLSNYTNSNVSSNDACCACGGGVKELDVRSKQPSERPSAAPTQCVDQPDWYWDVSKQYSCDHVSPSFCDTLSRFWNDGKNVKLACCVCGGGYHVSYIPSTAPSVKPTKSQQPTTSELPSSVPTELPSIQPSKKPSAHPSIRPSLAPTNKPSAQPTRLPSPIPSSLPTKSPSVFPTTQPTSKPSLLPSSSPSLQCFDFPFGWYDIEGPKFDCSWYADKLNCLYYGDDYSRLGRTANHACCVCGGGVTNAAPSNEPSHEPGNI